MIVASPKFLCASLKLNNMMNLSVNSGSSSNNNNNTNGYSATSSQERF